MHSEMVYPLLVQPVVVQSYVVESVTVQPVVVLLGMVQSVVKGGGVRLG